jgi:hypothetical protein
VLFFALLVFFHQSAAAQEKASLNGTVQDPQQAIVIGAVATLTNDKGIALTATSSDQGEYSFAELAEGVYTLVITAPGFQESRMEGVVVSAGQKQRLDVTLQPAKVVTQTTVEGQQGAQVETQQSQIAGTITQKELVKIGLNGRNFTQLIALAPGVSNQTGQDEAKVGVQGSVKYSVNGGRVEYNNFDVDGQDVLNAGINGSQSTLIVYPSLDALADVQVLTSNYGAQYGKTASGTILSTTKSGGAQFHGNVYYFNRNEIFNARNFFDHTRRAPLYRKNDPGFTLGGPFFIPGLYPREKSKTYFFWSEEWRIEKDPTGYTFNKAVPSLLQRAGDFNDICPPAAGPFVHSQYPDCPGQAAIHEERGTLLWSGLNNNSAPISPIGQAILNTNLIPLPNSTTGCNSPTYKNVVTPGPPSCFDATISPDTNWREDLIRIDHDLTSKARLTFRFIHDSWDTTVPLPQWAFYTNSFPTVQNDFNGPGTAAVVRWTQTITNTLLNQLLFGYTTDHITLKNIPGYGGSNVTRTSDFDSMGTLFNNGFGGKVPALAVGGNNAIYGGTGFFADTSYTPWKHSNPTYTIREDMSKAWGKHTLQFGALFLIAQRNEINPPVGSITGDIQGILGYSNVNNLNSTGNSFADLLLGEGIRSFTQDSAQLKYYQRYKIAEPYIQDDWRVTSRLTLNLGLRLSLFGNWHEKYNNVYNWVPGAFDPALAATAHVETFHGELVDNATNMVIPIDVANPDPRIVNGLVRCGTKGLPSSCVDSHVFNPEPRVGFAWDPFGKGRTSIRGGYGIFYEHGTGQEANTGSLEGSAPLVLGMAQQFPASYTNIGAPASVGIIGDTQGAAFPLNVTSIPKKSPYPYVQQWSLGVQQELPHQFISSVSYVGSKGTHLTAQLNLNQLQPVAASLNPFLAHQPITIDTCLPPLNNLDPLSEGFDGTNFHENGAVIGPGDPAYSNFLNVCQGNTAQSGVSVPIPLPNSLRTFAPTIGNIYSLQNIANSSYHAMQATVRKVKGPLTISLSYSYSHSIDDSSDRTDASFVNSFDIRANRASSNFDQRHLVAMSYIYQLPLANWYSRTFGWANDDPTNDLTKQSRNANQSANSGSKWSKFLTGWELSGIIVYQSGTPFSIINGGSPSGTAPNDNAGVANEIGVGSYADVIGDPHSNTPRGGIANTFGPLLGNPNAFAAPRGLTFGDAGRNSFNNPARTNFDTAILKTFSLQESRSLEFRFETFNTFNHTQFRVYNPDRGNVDNTISCYGGPLNTAGFIGQDTNCLTGSAFLHPVDAHRPRTIQLGVKFQF